MSDHRDGSFLSWATDLALSLTTVRAAPQRRWKDLGRWDVVPALTCGSSLRWDGGAARLRGSGPRPGV
ncbi:hypothetical protein [Actinoplanes sp. NPDC023714]|uniref:hypothetical protein n=1 Tax=Actinoplanes sp. NPDC023714 TaxID=3154322 RepID=UPI003404D2F2